MSVVPMASHPIRRRYLAESLVRLRRADEHPRYVASQRAEALRRTNFAAVYAPLPANLTVEQNLRICGLIYGISRVEARIEGEFPGVEALIHPDPDGLINETGSAAEELLPETAEHGG